MKNNTLKLLFLLCLLLCLIVPTTCTKLEKAMLVSTGEVTNILTNSAEASGQVIDMGEGATQLGHCYATTPNVTIAGSKTQLGVPAGTGGFTSQLANLEAGTKYYIKAYMSIGNETVYGKETNFSTVSASVPTLTTTPITSITTNSASSGGNITSNGGASVTAHGICWNIATSPTTANYKSADGTGTGSFAKDLTGLIGNTTYYVRAYATNSAGTAYGNELSFTTNPVIPTLTTTAIGSITTANASSGGNITNDGGASVTVRGVCWSLAINPTIANSVTSNGTGTGSFTSSIAGLISNTTYYVRAYAINNAGTGYGNELSFTTSVVTLTPPTAAAATATSVTNTTATINGAVNANGSSTTVTFEYGPTILYGSTAAATPSPVTGVNPTSVSAALTGLTPGTIYHFRVKAVNAGGTVYGDDLTFTTLQPPTAAAATATSVTNTTATINGAVNANGSSTTVTFEYGPTILYGYTAAATPSPVTGVSPTSVNAALTGLTAVTIYHFRVKAVSAGGTSYSDDLTFPTLQLPTATTEAATSVTNITATLNGTVNANNLSTTVTFEYGLTTSYGSTATATPSPVSGNTATSVSSSLTGLSEGTLYHFRVKAVSAGGTTYGSEVSFTTSTTVVPTLTTTTITSITPTTAISGGHISSDGGAIANVVGVCWSTATNPTTANSKTTNAGADVNGNFASSITGLTASTTYYVRAYATNSVGTAYGNELSFTTSAAVIPTLSLTVITLITRNTAISGGNITDDGGASVIERGVCWSSSGNPTIANSKTSDGPGMGSFVSNLTGLTAGTTYYVLSYATNSAGTAYGYVAGSVISFTTSAAIVPTLNTTTINSITSTTANSGGNISSDGGASVTARGVCWNTAINPTTANSKTTDGSGTGSFTSSVNGLTLGNTYYVRAYATNSAGTAYGNEVSFTTALAIGDSYQGGKVAYIFQSGDPGYIAGQTHGLIAAMDAQYTAIWSNGSYITTGAIATALFTGNLNTNTIVSSQGAGDYAAKFCYDLVLGGYGDWYLPSKDELNKLYINKAAIGGFIITFFWSSSETSSDGAWAQDFTSGSQYNSINKANVEGVLPVRAF